nr:hypothetical protein [Tanacetum cinerariifolium]
MTTTATQQVALDNALVPPEKRVDIGKCNMIINPGNTQKEPTYQVVLDALALTTYYPAFIITADVPEIYMHQFWYTINKHDSSYRFKIDNKRFTLNMEVFRKSSRSVQDSRIKNLLNFLQMKKLSPSSKNLDTKETLNLSLNKCETLMPSTSPNKARKFNKQASPSKKRILVTVEEEEPELAKKVLRPKKPSRKQSKQETSIHQAGGSSEGANFESKVLDEPKGMLIDTSKGTILKPGVPDVFKGDSSESEYESWGDNCDEANVQDDEDSDDKPQHDDDERTDFKNQEINNDEEETEDEFVHTPPNYVPTDDETNDESNNVDEEEYDRIDKELYSDVDIRLKDSEHEDEGKDDER